MTFGLELKCSGLRQRQKYDGIRNHWTQKDWPRHYGGGSIRPGLRQTHTCGAVKPKTHTCGAVKRQTDTCGAVKRQTRTCGAVKRQTHTYGAVKRQTHTCGAVKRQTHTCGAVKRQTDTCGAVKRQTHTCGAVKRQTHTCGAVKQQTHTCGAVKQVNGISTLTLLIIQSSTAIYKTAIHIGNKMFNKNLHRFASTQKNQHYYKNEWQYILQHT